MRILPVAYQRFFTRQAKQPFGDEPDQLWDELADPLNFVVGSLLLVSFGKNQAHDTPRAKELRLLTRSYRFGGTFSLAAIIALPALAPALWPSLGMGDEFVYAVTLFVGGAVTLVPNRLAELRNKHPAVITGSGYPKRLRKVMLALEWLTVFTTLLLILFWGFGDSDAHSTLRAIVWGVLAVCVAELYTFYSAVIFAYINEVASEFASGVDSD